MKQTILPHLVGFLRFFCLKPLCALKLASLPLPAPFVCLPNFKWKTRKKICRARRQTRRAVFLLLVKNLSQSNIFHMLFVRQDKTRRESESGRGAIDYQFEAYLKPKAMGSERQNVASLLPTATLLRLCHVIPPLPPRLLLFGDYYCVYYAYWHWLFFFSSPSFAFLLLPLHFKSAFPRDSCARLCTNSNHIISLRDPIIFALLVLVLLRHFAVRIAFVI